MKKRNKTSLKLLLKSSTYSQKSVPFPPNGPNQSEVDNMLKSPTLRKSLKTLNDIMSISFTFLGRTRSIPISQNNLHHNVNAIGQCKENIISKLPTSLAYNTPFWAKHFV